MFLCFITLEMISEKQYHKERFIEQLKFVLMMIAFSVPKCLVAQLMSDFATLWTIARQAPLSMGFFRQDCWTGLLFPPPQEGLLE